MAEGTTKKDIRFTVQSRSQYAPKEMQGKLYHEYKVNAGKANFWLKSTRSDLAVGATYVADINSWTFKGKTYHKTGDVRDVNAAGQTQAAPQQGEKQYFPPQTMNPEQLWVGVMVVLEDAKKKLAEMPPQFQMAALTYMLGHGAAEAAVKDLVKEKPAPEPEPEPEPDEIPDDSSVPF